jgi:hypothetical protein
MIKRLAGSNKSVGNVTEFAADNTVIALSSMNFSSNSLADVCSPAAAAPSRQKW